MALPRLVHSLQAPLHELEATLVKKTPEIEHWLRSEWREHDAPFYASVDLRNAGFKLAPVDTNLFPGGFNNLNPESLPLSVQAAAATIERICPDARGVLLIPENHTRNVFYLQNVAALRNILRHAGMNVRLGSLLPGLSEPAEVTLPDGGTLLLEPLTRRGRRVMVGDFDPCLVLLNNDLSAGIPEILRNLEQDVLPPTYAGWSTRRKSNHFAAYDDVVERFARLAGIDPWRINPYFARCGEINFQERRGEECLAAHASLILEKIREKYREYGIEQQPFVIVKADAGTYGMGIMTIKSPDEIRELNRKQRNKMAVVKEGLAVTEAIVQEGVHSFESVDSAVAEPVVYMIDHFVVGGFYRVHTSRGIDESLNAPGMHFVPLAFQSSCQLPDQEGGPDCPSNRFYVYGVIARLALLAAAIELEKMAPQQSVAAAA